MCVRAHSAEHTHIVASRLSLSLSLTPSILTVSEGVFAEHTDVCSNVQYVMYVHAGHAERAAKETQTHRLVASRAGGDGGADDDGDGGTGCRIP